MSVPDPRSIAQNGTCTRYVDMDLFLHYSLIPSLVIMVVLSSFERRVNRMRIDDKLPLNRRFGIVMPLDFIGSFNNRWTFGFAFGAIANKIMYLFSEGFTPLESPSWAKAALLLLAGLEVGFSYYPFFACLSTSSRFAGSILGFLYTACWCIVTTIHIVTCPHGQDGQFQEVIINWPSLLCLVFLLGRFLHMFIKAVRVYLGLEDEGTPEEQQVLLQHQADHVKRLMWKPSALQNEKSWFQRKIYEWDPYFKFPSRMVFTSVLTLTCLYIFIVLEIRLYNYAFQKFTALGTRLEEVVASSNDSATFEDAVAHLIRFTVILQDVWFFSTFTAIISSITYVLHILVCYRKHMKRLWSGIKTFLPERYHNFGSDQSVAAIARYSGWQIAYVLWGYQIIHVIQSLIGLAIMYIFVVPIKENRAVEMLKGLGIACLSITLVVVLVIIQSAIASVFFLQPKISPEVKGKPLALNNRKAFHTFNYLFFFYNVILGLSACLFRLFCSFFLGTWLVARIDRTILQKGYEGIDIGYKTWIGMIFVDHYHTNPTLLTFCYILLNGRNGKNVYTPSQNNFFQVSAEPRSSCRARIRWFLLYTLLKNPKLIMLRKYKEDSDCGHNSTAGQQRRLVQASLLTAEIKHRQERPGEACNATDTEPTPTETCSVAWLICPDEDV
ncbi:stimulated by retinoic acid gene 6 protein-like [Ambystoma mexicanum]|uniref:stimulated by retinoic acid gene 6 protein-like n=1 Tax=Ambystoma mexicanum TaxID=8296 RepID=UPI0037E7D807